MRTEKLRNVICIVSSVCCLTLILTCCSVDVVLGLDENDQFEETRSVVTNDNLHPLLQGHYVDFINNQYVITISKEEALINGISESCFDDFSKTIDDGNRLLASVIDSCLKTGLQIKVSANIYNCNKRKSLTFPRIKRTGEYSSFPSGTITTIGQEYGKQGISLIPAEMVSVDFDCYSYVAPCPIQIVIAESWGIKDIKSGIGQHVCLNAGFSVTNVPGNVQYATTDSNGGTCSWQGRSH